MATSSQRPPRRTRGAPTSETFTGHFRHLSSPVDHYVGTELRGARPRYRNHRHPTPSCSWRPGRTPTSLRVPSPGASLTISCRSTIRSRCRPEVLNEDATPSCHGRWEPQGPAAQGGLVLALWQDGIVLNCTCTQHLVYLPVSVGVHVYIPNSAPSPSDPCLRVHSTSHAARLGPGREFESPAPPLCSTKVFRILGTYTGSPVYMQNVIIQFGCEGHSRAGCGASRRCCTQPTRRS